MKQHHLMIAGLLAGLPAITVQAGTFQSVGPSGFWHSPSAWALVEGADVGEDGIPSAGDDVVVLAGHLIEMHEPHEANAVTVQGRLQGSTFAAPFDLTHTLGSVTIQSGGEFDLADGRDAEAVFVNITGDLVLESGSIVKAASFGDLATITLNLGGDYVDANTGGFAFYGGAETGDWNFNFVGTDSATFSMLPGASRDFSSITVEAGKELTVNSTHPIYTAFGGTVTVETGAIMMLANGAFFSGPGDFTMEPGATLGVAAAHGVLRSALFQNSGTTVLPESANYVFNGVLGQNTGIDLPSAVNSLVIDTPDWVTLSQNVNVSGELSLMNGRLETNELTVFAGQNESQIVRTNGYIDGNLARSFDAADTGARLFPVGTESDYLPVIIDITSAGSGFGFLTVAAVGETFAPAPDDPALPFHWIINGPAFSDYTAALVFSYPQDEAPATETALRMARYSNGTFNILSGQVVDVTANTITVPGVSSFSSWVPVVGGSSVSDWAVY